MFRLYSIRLIPPVVLFMLMGWSCEPLVTIFEDIEEAQHYQAAQLTAALVPDTLLIMTWNIKYGGGSIDFWWACYDERVLMTENEVLTNLEGLAAYINLVDPDILLLQEVDVNSKRAAYVDQMQYLLDHTDLNYGVYASMWEVQFAPSDGLGRADLGPAILSRWPLEEAERISLPLRTDQDALTKYFYLRRCLLKATIPQIGGLEVVNVHTSAWQAETKVMHIERFREELDAIHAAGGLFIAGGDLNTLPPDSKVISGFRDTMCMEGDFEGGDYSGEERWLDALYDYATAVSLEKYHQADRDDPYYTNPYFTYGDKPDSLGFTRKLDYLFTNNPGGWIAGSDSTRQDIAAPGVTLSDHCPISVRISLP